MTDRTHLNPVKRTFTPSYPAETREEYEEMVRTGKKRFEHVQVEGGRTSVRYGGKGRGREAETVPGLASLTKKRLAQQQPPWDARTQALLAWERAHQEGGPRASVPLVSPTDLPLVHRIEAAIEAYRTSTPKGELGFFVPHSPLPLIQAGMPNKVANILVRRAGGAFFPAVGLTAISPPPSLEQDISRLIGGRMYVWRGMLNVPVAGERQPEEVERFVLLGPQGQRETALTAANIRAAHDAWREKPREKPYLPSDDVKFVQAVYIMLVDTIRATARRWGTTELTLVLITTRQGVRRERQLSVREHSKVAEQAAPVEKVKYRSLRNVDLHELPTLLASLARRRKREGRRLQILGTLGAARSNPMADANALLELVAQKAEAGELVPVPGKPGRVYWPVSIRGGGGQRRYTGLKETTERRAQSWLAIQEAGKQARGQLKRVALEAHEPKITAQENSMGRARKNFDDPYFFEQYRKSPYGAQQAIPVARRNKGDQKKRAAAAMNLFHSGQAPTLKAAWAMVNAAKFGRAVLNPVTYARAATENRRKKRVKRKANPMAVAAFQRAQVLFQQQGCSWKTALKQAWADVKGAAGFQAAANPWYIPELVPSLHLPDTTVHRSALVGAPYDYQDLTQDRSALERGAYSMPVVPNPHHPGHHPLRAAARQLAQLHRMHEGLEERDLPPGVHLKHGGRGGGSGMFPIAQQSGYDFPRFEGSHDMEGGFSHGERSGVDPTADWGASNFWGGRQPGKGSFAYRLGQYSPQATSGFQPVNRRNPKRKAKKNGKKKR